MPYPLVDTHLFPSLRLVHASYNSLVMLLFFYHGWLGITIRRARKSKAPLPLAAVKRHRKTGPVLAIMGGFGFLIGFSLTLLDSGNILEFPAHFIVGCSIVLCLLSTFLISRKIKGPDSPYRTPHFVLGITVLCLYLIQVLLGIGVLF
ncbi:MAG TPA: DUF4079 family protein [Nitrospirota bacterium]|nr:DUF4079 family protein [Nitrospirota bacterium]